MTKILGIDLETTGLDFKTDRITEIGAVIWDTKEKRVLEVLSELVVYPTPTTISKEITEITGITVEMLTLHGQPITKVLDRLQSMALKCKYFCAHNAAFDSAFLVNCPFLPGPDERCWYKPWIDTKEDIPGRSGLRLIHLAAEEGILNPFPHRAVTDVLTMLQVVGKYDFKDIERYALAPRKTLIANVSFENKDFAKNLGYGWNPQERTWSKVVRDFQVEEEIKKAQETGKFLASVA